MKYIRSILVFAGLFLVSACPGLKNSAAESNNGALSTTFRNQNNAENSDQRFTTPYQPAVSVFHVVLSPFRYGQKKDKKQSFDFFDDRVFSFFGAAEAMEKTEFDIINEYGFLGRGRIVKFVKPTTSEAGYWKIEIIKDSLRADLSALAGTRMSETESEMSSLPAFGIFPSRSERKSVWSGGKIDAGEKALSERRAVYLSLPPEVRDNANVYGQAGALEYPNGWADLNGDRTIDFVDMRVRCAEKPNAHCEKVLILLDGKWQELPEKTGES